MTLLAPSMQSYFTDRLIGQRNASPNTIAAYRNTFQLLLRFVTDRTETPPSTLDISDLDAPLIAAFLDHLQTVRGNTIRTRNNRLAAIHSLFAYLALNHPEHADTIARVLAIPDPEVDALLAACDQATWTGRRDHAMLALTIQTGLRISELISLNCQDITLGTGANVHTIGKGRKERRTPLIPTIRTVLKAWLHERGAVPDKPLFPTRTITRLSRDAVEHRLTIHLKDAARDCPSLNTKPITMHTLRHTCAMRLLLAGNDITVIALWLGHEQLSTTNIYLHADMTHKQQAIDRTRPIAAKPGRYQPLRAAQARHPRHMQPPETLHPLLAELARGESLRLQPPAQVRQQPQMNRCRSRPVPGLGQLRDEPRCIPLKRPSHPNPRRVPHRTLSSR
jgi:integrase/recombinase XerD